MNLSLEAKELPPGSGRGNLFRRVVLAGVIAAVVIGVGVYFLSQPREGTVEWHKRGYVKTIERISQNTWRDKLKRVYRRVARRPPAPNLNRPPHSSDLKALQHHLQSLVQLGYLRQTSVSLTNTDPLTAIRAAFPDREPTDVLRDFVFLTPDSQSPVVNICAPTSDLPKIEAAIRQADVPEKKQ